MFVPLMLSRACVCQFAIMANHMPLLYQLLDNPNRLLDQRQHLRTHEKQDAITRSLHYALLQNKAEVR